MVERRRRFVAVLIVALLIMGGMAVDTIRNQRPSTDDPAIVTQPVKPPGDPSLASTLLDTLPVKGRAPKTGYTRSQFGNGWAELGACDIRNHILRRDLTDVKVRSDTDCTVLSGTLDDPYTGNIIQFNRGVNSSAVQIDHIVALSDAWQKGAQALTPAERAQLANDPLELLAADGPANNEKGAGDAATWLPPNKDYRCRYIARQIAVKAKYRLWVTTAERDAIKRVLATCPNQLLPIVQPQ